MTTVTDPETPLVLPQAADATPPRSRRIGRSPGVPATPDARVNLLSPWVLASLRARRLRQRFLMGGLALAVVLGVGWVALTLHLDQARAELRGDDAVAAGLSAQIAELSEVREYVASVTRRSVQVEDTMSGQVALSRLLEELAVATPDGASVESVTVTLPTAPTEGESEGESESGIATTTCPGPDPFGAAEIVGCVQIRGTARDRDTVSKLVIRLARNSLFVEPFVSTTTVAGDEGVSFDGSVGLTPEALSGRYRSTEPVDETTSTESDSGPAGAGAGAGAETETEEGAS